LFLPYNFLEGIGSGFGLPSGYAPKYQYYKWLRILQLQPCFTVCWMQRYTCCTMLIDMSASWLMPHFPELTCHPSDYNGDCFTIIPVVNFVLTAHILQILVSSSHLYSVKYYRWSSCLGYWDRWHRL